MENKEKSGTESTKREDHRTKLLGSTLVLLSGIPRHLFSWGHMEYCVCVLTSYTYKNDVRSIAAEKRDKEVVKARLDGSWSGQTLVQARHVI